MYGVVLLALFYFVGQSRGRQIESGAFTFVVVVAAGMLAAWYRLAKSTGASHLLILDRKGVYFDDPRFDCGLIPWRSVAKAKRSFLTGRFYILDHDGAKVLSCPSERLGKPRTLHQCIRAINDLLPLYTEGREVDERTR